MPVITVEMVGGRSVAQKRQLVREFTESFARICHVTPDVVTIVIHEVQDEHWAMGGKTKAQVKEEQGG